MLPKRYHAIIFISILVMLLLLGLHLLGLGFGNNGVSGGNQTARTAALARNSSSQSSSSSGQLAASQNHQAYRHPIVYDKLTGATNNQINDVLGSKHPGNDYPIDHYEQQQQQQRQLEPLSPFNQLPQDDFFANMHRQQPGGAGGFPTPANGHLASHPMAHHMRPRPPPMIGPPPPLVQIPAPPAASGQSQRERERERERERDRQPLQLSPAADVNQRVSQAGDSQLAPAVDSLPSASSLNNNPASSAPLNASSNQQQQQQIAQLNAQPIYYTPPIFAYNNFDQTRQLNEPQMSLPYGLPSGAYQQAQQQQLRPVLPPMGVPEPPMSVDEYNARQARLRQLQQPPNSASNELPQGDRYAKLPLQQQQQQQAPLPVPQRIESQFGSAPGQQSPNLLADPQQQLRHKQQMLDRQLLFGNSPFASGPPLSLENELNVTQLAPNGAKNLTHHYLHPELYRAPPPVGALRGPPYAHGMSMAGPSGQQDLDQQFALKQQQQSAQNRILSPLTNRLDPIQQQQVSKVPERLVATLKSNGVVPQQLIQPQQPATAGGGGSFFTSQPLCARQHQVEPPAAGARNLELLPPGGSNSSLAPQVLFCNEDPEYPTKEIMRALESYATERSIEHLLPQLLVQIQTAQRMAATATASASGQTTLPGASSSGSGSNPASANQVQLADLQRQLALDSLQPSIGALGAAWASAGSQNGEKLAPESGSNQLVAMFPSANYEPMCRSSIYMAQPRRAKNLFGHWKVVVNLPGHKYRGIAVSQMLRIEECSKPNTECAGPSNTSSGSGRALNALMGSKSRCLQHYENQRLVAWSHQQGLHVDIFRVPVACSCHIRR